MGARSGLCLKFLQWFVRGIQFCCHAVVLAIFAYFLAAMHNHQINIPTWTRAVTGISGAGVLYSIIGLLLLCCLAGHPVASFMAVILDVAFIGAYIYVAQANRGGANSCTGNSISTPFGTGSANSKPTGPTDGFTALPTFRAACQMQSACLAVSIVLIIFLIFSILVEFALVRTRRKEKRFGPSPANNYTSGYGGRRGLFGFFKRRRNTATKADDANVLPQHTTPDQIRSSYQTESTAVGNDGALYNKHGESGFTNEPHAHDGHTAYPDSGVVGHPNSGYPTTGVTGHYNNTTGQRYNDGTYNV